MTATSHRTMIATIHDKQVQKMKNAPGFIAALDQSGGSTPKALRLYGIPDDSYVKNETSMFDQVHNMRERIMSSDVFHGDRILAAILFEDTVKREVQGIPTAKYLWEQKEILPILKIDQGLEAESNGVQMMKPLTKLDGLLELAKQHHIFGTKARSFIKTANKKGIEVSSFDTLIFYKNRNQKLIRPATSKDVVEQQFKIGKIVCTSGMHPILEPEVDIHSTEKEAAEAILKEHLLENLNKLAPDEKVLLKLTLPSTVNLYNEIIAHPNVLRVVALSGGYTRAEANSLLMRNHGMVASFSRALTEGLRADDSSESFDAKLDASINSIYTASVGNEENASEVNSTFLASVGKRDAMVA